MIEEELELRVKQLKEIDKLVEAQRMPQRTRYDIEMIRELGYCQGIENYSRYLSGRRRESRRQLCLNTCPTTPSW